MPFRRGSRVKETTISQGVGPIVLDGGAPGFLPFNFWAVAGDQMMYVIDAGEIWEAGVGTLSVAGGVWSLARSPAENHLGTTAAISLPAGTKTVFSGVSQKMMPLLNQRNDWSGDQKITGRIFLDADETAWIDSLVNNAIRMSVGTDQALNIYSDLQWYLKRNDALEGPGVEVYRERDPGAAPGDYMGFLRFCGDDSAGAKTTYVKMRSRIGAASAGAQTGELTLEHIRSGTLRTVLHLFSNWLRVYDDTGLLVTKAATGIGSDGIELRATGQAAMTTNGLAPLQLNRRSSDGNLVEFYRDGSNVGQISVSGGVVAYGAFAAAHPYALEDGGDPAALIPGTVLASTGRMMATPCGPDPRHVLCRPARGRADRRSVYGVASGCMTLSFARPWGTARVRYGRAVCLGVHPVLVDGPVRNGAFLVPSRAPGKARASRLPIRTPAVLGKAVGADFVSDGRRQVLASIGSV